MFQLLLDNIVAVPVTARGTAEFPLWCGGNFSCSMPWIACLLGPLHHHLSSLLKVTNAGRSLLRGALASAASWLVASLPVAFASQLGVKTSFLVGYELFFSRFMVQPFSTQLPFLLASVLSSSGLQNWQHLCSLFRFPPSPTYPGLGHFFFSNPEKTLFS